MKAMMTAMMTAAIKGCLFIFLPSACLQGLRSWALGFQGSEGLGRKGIAPYEGERAGSISGPSLGFQMVRQC